MSIGLHDWIADRFGEQYCTRCGEERCRLTELAQCEGYETSTDRDDSDGGSRVLDANRS